MLVIEAFVYCAEEGKRAYGRVLPPRAPGLSQATLKRPIEPVGAFAPWNFPAFLAARKLAAALAAGCTVVLKPAEETPAACIEIVRCVVDAGVPAGVVNLLFGVPARISQAVIDSPVIRKISFTGSVPVGRLLAERAGRQLKPATMELGGHAPVIVFDDVDVARVAAACAAFKFRNAGQVCLSPSRFYVQAAIVDEFTEAFVAEACGRGARIATGGQRLGKVGYFHAPTVLVDVPPQARLLHEEPFCPVAPVMAFDTLDEAITLANGLPFGLAAYAFTNRLDRSTAFVETVEAGWIGINDFTPSLADAPIGGTKDSGLGYEGGPEGLDAYLHARFVSQAAAPI